MAAVLLDIAYLVFLVLASPVLAILAWRGRLSLDREMWLGRGAAIPREDQRAVRRILIHAVSVGEVNAIRGLVQELRRTTPAPEIVVSSATNAGLARAKELFGASLPVVRSPMDFSFAVRRWLRRADADVLVTVELELWPNMTQLAAKRGMPIVVINGRLSDRSIRRYRRVRWLLTSMFRRATVVLAQNRDYAERFSEMGALDVRVTGNMKWDSVAIRDAVPGAVALASELGLPVGAPLVVAGSTEPGEELLLRDALPDGARLLIAPRQPAWWDGVATNLPGCVRRSRGERGSPETRYFVLDTIGELGMAYSLATVVVIGRSFGKLYGSDPVEPAALGKPVIIGPRVADFREVVATLRMSGGIVQVDTAGLRPALAEMCASAARRTEVAAAARQTIVREQGATMRTVEVILATPFGMGVSRSTLDGA